jgi:hypothetical protein
MRRDIHEDYDFSQIEEFPENDIILQYTFIQYSLKQGLHLSQVEARNATMNEIEQI